MSGLRSYERKAIAILTKDVLPAGLVETVVNEEPVSYEYTGAGYFVTLRNTSLPKERIVCSKPMVIGQSQGVDTGFIVFLGNHELLLECHAWSESSIPETYRDQEVSIVAT